MEEYSQRIRELAAEVSAMRDMLISEPQASPLGRTLSRRIDDVEERLEPIARWHTEWAGVWKFALGLATVLGIIGAFFGLAARFGWQ